MKNQTQFDFVSARFSYQEETKDLFKRAESLMLKAIRSGAAGCDPFLAGLIVQLGGQGGGK